MKYILICGDGLNLSDQLKSLYRQPQFLLIGDGASKFNPQYLKKMIIDNGGISYSTRVDILAHGSLVSRRHYLSIFEGFEHNFTSFLLLSLQALAPVIPLNIHLWSCYGGAAVEDINLLSMGSTITAHNPSSCSGVISYNAIYTVIKQSRGTFLEELERNLLLSGQDTLSIAIKLKNGSSEVFNFSPPVYDYSTVASFARRYLKFLYMVRERFSSFEAANLLPKQLVYIYIPNSPILCSHVQLNSFLINYLPNAIEFFQVNSRNLIRSMVRSGFDLDSSDENQLRLLEVAVSLEGKTFPRHRYELVKVLIELGVDINRKTQGRCTTALMMAAVHGRNECIELLIRSGAILDKQGPDGVTALIGAAIYGYKNCVELLLKAGAKRNLVNDEGRTAIDLASSQGHMECVNLLRQEATQVLSKPIVIKKKAFTPKYPIAAKRKQTPWVKRIAKPQEQNKIQPPKEKYFVCGKFTRRHVAMLGVATATIATGLIFSIGSAMQSSR